MKNFETYLLDNFKYFHRNPEMPYEESKTTAKIKEILTANGIKIVPYPLKTGLVAVVRGEKQENDSDLQKEDVSDLCAAKQNADKRNVTALRIDIDALPITEEAEVDYRSETEGYMHACGHDFHITAGLGAAILLQEKRKTFSKTVKFIFQPAEEEAHGALRMIETGVMDDVPLIWGFHADPTNEINTVGIREGYVTAAVDRFVIKIEGVGCHGAHPDDGVDPIVTAAAIIQSLQTIVSRNANSFRPTLLSVTRVEAGTTWNVIPKDAELEGTVRTLHAKDRKMFAKRLKDMAQQIASAYGAKAEVIWDPGPPATYNDLKLSEICREVAENRGMNIVYEEDSLGGDDFAFYEDDETMKRHIPGCYAKIGTGKGYPIHHPKFKVDTSVLVPTAEFLADLLIKEC